MCSGDLLYNWNILFLYSFITVTYGDTNYILLKQEITKFHYLSYTQIGYSAVGAVIFSLYIIYDTQIMLGGNHKYSLSPEEYIFAALNLYLDIINLFMYLLSIFGGSRK